MTVGSLIKFTSFSKESNEVEEASVSQPCVSNFRISDIENFRFSNCHVVHFFFICQFSRVVKKLHKICCFKSERELGSHLLLS